MPLMDVISPPLTTVRIEHREMGRQAAQLMLEVDSVPEPRHVVLAPELIVRGSTAPFAGPARWYARAVDGNRGLRREMPRRRRSDTHTLVGFSMSNPRPPSLEQLHVLLTVVEAGSFAAAGRKLGRATSAISYAIDTIETQLGLPLFVRGTTKRPTLTPAGHAVVA